MARLIKQTMQLLALLSAGAISICSPVAFADSSASAFKPFAFEVSLEGTSAGNLTVTAHIGGIEREFLVDTGASMVTVEKALFDELRKLGTVVKVRSVAARLANGKIQALDVYLVDQFLLGSQCNLGPIEIAVVPRGVRNLLGMNALNQAAPFGLSIEPPALGLTRCASDTLVSSIQQ